VKRCYAAGLAIGISLWISGCSGTPPPAPDTRAADEKNIREGETAWNADFTAKDVDKVLNHYADDAVLMMPGMPAAKGKDSIRGALTELVHDKNFAISFAPAKVEVARNGDIAYSQGTYTLSYSAKKTGRPLNEAGSYLTVYKKQPDGGWKAIEDTTAADAPPASPAPAKKAKAKAVRRKSKR
jgi:uncharacterized protein (TIGR02246 family)